MVLTTVCAWMLSGVVSGAAIGCYDAQTASHREWLTRQDRQCRSMRLRSATLCAQLGVEAVVVILVKVQREIERGDELFFQRPWRRMLDEADTCMIGHPRRQGLLPRRERATRTATDASKFDAEVLREEHAECESKRGAFGVAGVVITNPGLQRCFAWWFAVHRRSLW